MHPAGRRVLKGVEGTPKKSTRGEEKKKKKKKKSPNSIRFIFFEGCAYLCSGWPLHLGMRLSSSFIHLFARENLFSLFFCLLFAVTGRKTRSSQSTFPFFSLLFFFFFLGSFFFMFCIRFNRKVKQDGLVEVSQSSFEQWGYHRYWCWIYITRMRRPIGSLIIFRHGVPDISRRKKMEWHHRGHLIAVI